ncbi:hypothetical protein LY76DRAFT_640355, partial [Colletotrichum caudatum]
IESITSEVNVNSLLICQVPRADAWEGTSVGPGNLSSSLCSLLRAIYSTLYNGSRYICCALCSTLYTTCSLFSNLCCILCCVLNTIPDFVCGAFDAISSDRGWVCGC